MVELMVEKSVAKLVDMKVSSTVDMLVVRMEIL
jgi:hypothetical protein